VPSTAQEVAAAIERERLLQVRCVETAYESLRGRAARVPASLRSSSVAPQP